MGSVQRFQASFSSGLDLRPDADATLPYSRLGRRDAGEAKDVYPDIVAGVFPHSGAGHGVSGAPLTPRRRNGKINRGHGTIWAPYIAAIQDSGACVAVVFSARGVDALADGMSTLEHHHQHRAWSMPMRCPLAGTHDTTQRSMVIAWRMHVAWVR